MARARKWWAISNLAPSLIIWAVSALSFYAVFQMVFRNSDSSGTFMLNVDRRAKLYDDLSGDLDKKGAAFLRSGETSQSLSISDLFTVKDGAVMPVLRAVNPPVRANVLYLSPQYSVPIAEVVQKIFTPYFDKVIWFQNSTLYHFSMVHASHHISPVPASEVQIEAEINAVKDIAKNLCPLKISLDRVVLTSTGVLLGCWQVISGSDPVLIREKLRSALPRAPKKQLYDPAILHTSLARLLGHPTNLPEEKKVSELQFLHELVNDLNSQLHGFQATVSELWYVEEYDVLALAVDGKIKAHKFHLGCSQP